MTYPNHLEGTPAEWVARDRDRVESRRGYETVKRQFDVFGASFLLLLTAPLLIVAALAIRVSTPGPVLFRHARFGRHGQIFTMYKLRTMRWGGGISKSRGAPQYSTSIVEHSYRKPRHDSAITGVGGLLRRWSIDELPNLFNVLLGQMSLVGPRPIGYSPEVYGPAQHQLFSVKPGVTGLWQVMGRGELTIAQRVTFDVEYVQRRSMGFDLWIIMKTIPTVLSRRGAF